MEDTIKKQARTTKKQGGISDREDARAGHRVRMAVRGRQGVSREKEKGRERKGKLGCVLDRLSFELDTVITTKTRLRALKLTQDTDSPLKLRLRLTRSPLNPA